LFFFLPFPFYLNELLAMVYAKLRAFSFLKDVQKAPILLYALNLAYSSASNSFK